jgi:uncharacterized damage-inducible protein DinB
MKTLLYQYELIKDMREVVFTYCESMQPQHYTQQVEHFGRGGTVKDLQAHIASSYLFWLELFAQGRQPSVKDIYSNTTVAQIRTAFDVVNSVVEDFFKTFEGKYFDEITAYIPPIDKTDSIAPIRLFSHVSTHEFHHKGQIMSMGRMLGYTPPDTDLIRF